jgi:hypothetical protein
MLLTILMIRGGGPTRVVLLVGVLLALLVRNSVVLRLVRVRVIVLAACFMSSGSGFSTGLSGHCRLVVGKDGMIEVDSIKTDGLLDEESGWLETFWTSFWCGENRF